MKTMKKVVFFIKSLEKKTIIYYCNNHLVFYKPTNVCKMKYQAVPDKS